MIDWATEGVVYALHAGDYDYRYVGLTKFLPEHRLYAHKLNAVNGGGLYVHRWMRLVGVHNVRVQVLESHEDHRELGPAETKWIAILKARGHRLTNLTEGGDGCTGYRPTPEVKAKISATLTGRKRGHHALAHRMAIAASLKALAEDPNHNLRVNRAPEGLGNHVRWHVKRGTKKDGCKFCGQ